MTPRPALAAILALAATLIAGACDRSESNDPTTAPSTSQATPPNTNTATAESPTQTLVAGEFIEDPRVLQFIVRADRNLLDRALQSMSDGDASLTKNTDRAIRGYLDACIALRDANDVPISQELLEVRTDDPQWVWIGVNFPLPRDAQNLELLCRLFHDIDEGHNNIVDILVNQNSTRVSYTEPAWKPLSLPDGPDIDLTPFPEVIVRGNAPRTLILLPNHRCDWSAYENFLSRNEDLYTMYAVTLPGMNATKPPPPPLPAELTPWMDNAVAALAHLIQSRNLDKPAILGAGLGGVIAYRLAIEHPDLAGPIITLDAMPAFPISREPIPIDTRLRMADVMKAQMDGATPEQWDMDTRRFSMSIFAPEERRNHYYQMFTRTPANIQAQYLLENIRTDLTPRLAEINSPVLAIAALNELNASRRLYASDMLRMWVDQTEGAPDDFTVVYYDNTSQFVEEEHPEKVDKAVADFLAEHPPAN